MVCSEQVPFLQTIQNDCPGEEREIGCAMIAYNLAPNDSRSEQTKMFEGLETMGNYGVFKRTKSHIYGRCTHGKCQLLNHTLPFLEATAKKKKLSGFFHSII